jgi:hypothetical protein
VVNLNVVLPEGRTILEVKEIIGKRPLEMLKNKVLFYEM